MNKIDTAKFVYSTAIRPQFGFITLKQKPIPTFGMVCDNPGCRAYFHSTDQETVRTRAVEHSKRDGHRAKAYAGYLTSPYQISRWKKVEK